MMEPGILMLEDGLTWEGALFGAKHESHGEAVFNTAFAGYEEVLTDPSYAGQIVVMAAPHLGNYGITLEDMESSRCYLKGFVVKDLSAIASNWRSKKNLEAFLREQKVAGLCDVDTRGLVKHLRQKGAMRAAIAQQKEKADLLLRVQKAPGMLGADFVQEVSPAKIRHYKNKGERIVLYDFGLKQNILNHLLALNFEVFVLPAATSASEALKLKPAGILLSNGPGDPAALPAIIENIKTLLKAEIPTLGICLGYQVLSLALNAKTYKLKFGHRGVNHPVQNLETGHIAITSHNHGFSVESESLPKALLPTHLNLYDKTLEGFRHRDFPFSGVQFHPEASPGPHDAGPIFKDFATLVKSAQVRAPRTADNTGSEAL